MQGSWMDDLHAASVASAEDAAIALVAEKLPTEADTIATLQAKLDRALEGLEMACWLLDTTDCRNSKGAKTAQAILKELRP